MRTERPKKEATSTDLFAWLDAIWTKQQHDGTPPTFMMHRFLAAEKDFAIVARYLQVEVRDPKLIFGCWQAMTPVGKGAPRLAYVAAKRAPNEEALVTKLKTVLAESRRACEVTVDMVKKAGRIAELYAEMGLEVPKDDDK